jgi:hypothetical protein
VRCALVDLTEQRAVVDDVPNPIADAFEADVFSESACSEKQLTRQQADGSGFLVLGGDGWKLRDYFTSGKLSEHLIHAGWPAS